MFPGACAGKRSQGSRAMCLLWHVQGKRSKVSIAMCLPGMCRANVARFHSDVFTAQPIARFDIGLRLWPSTTDNFWVIDTDEIINIRGSYC